MSDTASTVEIEDVLASVRRLVSSDRSELHGHRLVPPSSGTSAESPAAEDPVDKLILTADLRVSEAVDPAENPLDDRADTPMHGPEAMGEAVVFRAIEEDTVSAAARPVSRNLFTGEADGPDRDGVSGPAPAGLPAEEPDPIGSGVGIQTLEDRIAQLETAVSSHTPADFEPDGSEDQAQHRPQSVPTRSAAEEAAATAEPMPDSASDDPEGPEAAKGAMFVRAFVLRNPEPVDPGTEIAGTGAEQPATSAAPSEETRPAAAQPETDPDVGPSAAPVGDLDAAPAARRPAPADDGDIVEDREAAPDEAPDEAADEAPVEDPAGRATADPFGKAEPAAEETTIPFAHERREPEAEDGTAVPFPGTQADDDWGDDAAYDDWEDEDDAFDPEARFAGLDIGDEPVEIDEDMLRDMVAEIVREELQGALGERITRNVRKLVRREIMRALAIREFE